MPSNCFNLMDTRLVIALLSTDWADASQLVTLAECLNLVSRMCPKNKVDLLLIFRNLQAPYKAIGVPQTVGCQLIVTFISALTHPVTLRALGVVMVLLIPVRDALEVNAKPVFPLFPLPVLLVQLPRRHHPRRPRLQLRPHLLANRFALALRVTCACMRLRTQITQLSRSTRVVPL